MGRDRDYSAVPSKEPRFASRVARLKTIAASDSGNFIGGAGHQCVGETLADTGADLRVAHRPLDHAHLPVDARRNLVEPNGERELRPAELHRRVDADVGLSVR